MEFWRQPATATIITFPLFNSSGIATSGASSLDSEFVAWSDSAAPGNGNNFADMTSETTEIGATGIYTLSIAATELPAASPYVMIQVKSSLATQYILINTATQYVDVHRWRGSSPLVLSSGRVDTTVGAMQTGVITAAAHAAGAIDAAAIATDAIGAAELADGAITAATFAAGAIDATAIATGAIDADAIADNAIDAGALAANAITAAKIADGAIDFNTFASGVLPANFPSQVINASGYVMVGQIATYAVAATSFEDSAITARSLAADAITAAKVAVDVGSEFADAFLKRNVASGSTGGREVREAMALLRNKVAIAAGTMTVNDTDDTTALWTASVATVSYNAQVVTIDPA